MNPHKSTSGDASRTGATSMTTGTTTGTMAVMTAARSSSGTGGPPFTQMSRSPSGNPAPASDATVYVVDDDPGVLKSMCLALATSQLPVRPFASAEDFLRGYL